MKLSEILTNIGNGLKAIEHGALSFINTIEGLEQGAQKFIGSPAVQAVIAAIPQAQPALAVFEAQKALVDQVDALVNASVALPAELTQAHANLKAAVAAVPKPVS